MVLLITHLFHPIDGLPVEQFMDRDVRHGRGRSGAVPMFFPRRDPNHVTRTDFLDRSAPALRPATASRDNQRLPEWMRVPGGTSAGLEGDARTRNASRIGRLVQRVDTHCAGKPVVWAFARRLGAASFNFHVEWLSQAWLYPLQTFAE